jgi:hypothetical protein
MSRKRKETLPEPVRRLVATIEASAEKSDERTIKIAMALRELRRRVERGEVGKVRWYIWVDENVRLQKSRIGDLLRIAEAENPRTEAAHLRELNARRQVRFRAKEKKKRMVELPRECRDIIDWARTATVDDAKAVLRVIETRSKLA